MNYLAKELQLEEFKSRETVFNYGK